MKLVDKYDPILRQVQPKFDFKNPPTDPVLLYAEMKETLLELRGLGLSACQVGLPYNMFVFGNPDEPETIIPVFNPIIVSQSEKMVSLEEGCLTFPGLYFKVSRPESIRCRYASHEGQIGTHTFVGMTARIFQHEVDHCNGILFTKRGNRYHVEKAQISLERNARERLRHSNLQSRLG